MAAADMAGQEKKGLIISGGQIEDGFALDFVHRHPGEEIIAADRGLMFCRRHGVVPSHIVGDFDSTDESGLEYFESRPDVQIHRYPSRKDQTDTELAVSLAISLGWQEIILLGATGTRVDHMMGNLMVMVSAMRQGARIIILDPHNRITLHQESFSLKKAEQYGRYISMIPWGGEVSGFTLHGFSYDCRDVRLTPDSSLGISNQLREETGTVTFRDGMLLVVEAAD